MSDLSLVCIYTMSIPSCLHLLNSCLQVGTQALNIDIILWKLFKRILGVRTIERYNVSLGNGKERQYVVGQVNKTPHVPVLIRHWMMEISSACQNIKIQQITHFNLQAMPLVSNID